MKRYFENTTGTHNKFWEVEVDGVLLHRRWGRIGTNGQSKTETFANRFEAEDEERKLISEKLGGGYVEKTTAATSPTSPAPAPTPTPAPRRLLPMLATEVAAAQLIRYAADANYIFECKLDGHRVMLVVDGGQATALGRNGQPSQHNARFQDRRHAPELARLSKMRHVVLDGELVGEVFWVFDMPQLEWSGGIELTFDENEAWEIRRRALGLVFQAWRPDPNLFRLLPYAEGEEDKLELARKVKAELGEGIVIKRAQAPYQWGARNQDTLKAKYVNEADLVVKALGHAGKDNAVLGAWKDGNLIEVGRCSTIGKQAVRIGDVVCVRYLYLGAGNRIVQPRLMSVRTDKDVRECTFDQLVGTNKDVIA